MLAGLGIMNAGYLAFKHREGKPLVCPIEHDCNAVVESTWNKILGIRNEYLGLLYYIALFAAAIAAVTSPFAATHVDRYVVWVTGAGVLYSAFLTGVQIFALKDYCFYCLLSALTSLLLFINSFFLLS